MDHPLHLVGLGGIQTCPLGFAILQAQINEITGYDEDVVFLIVPEESDFAGWVPIVIGTCMLGCIVNVIKEGKLDQLSTPWSMV